jgi:hypothetical protein
VDVRVLSKPFDIGLLEKLLKTIQREMAQTGSNPATQPAQ